jgi:DUF4097 and DUF4098 domain-containing protein YvlB
VLLALPYTACGDDATGPDGDAVISLPFEFVEDATGRIGFQLTGVNGTINVTGLSEGETFTVSGFRQIRECSQSAAEAWIDQLEVLVTPTPTTIIIQTDQPHNTSPCNLVVDYELTIPERLVGQIINVNGTITVDGLDERIFVTNVNGNVTLEDIEDDATVRLTNGNIVADVQIGDRESIDLLTVNGNVDLDIPTFTNALLSITVANGSIVVSNLTVQNEVSTATSLSGTLGTGEGTIILGTTNGNISLTGV